MQLDGQKRIHFIFILYFQLLFYFKEQCLDIKGIVHFEIHFWFVLAYLKGIQDVGVKLLVFEVVLIFIFLSQTVVCQSYNGGLWSPPQRACTEKSKLNMI